MFKTHALKVISTFLFFLTAVNNAAGIENPPPPPMTLQLIYPAGKYDPGKRDNGMIRAELRNEGLTPITVPLGYDGVKIRLMSRSREDLDFPVVLRTRFETKRNAEIQIQAGETRTIFELPLSEIFFQNGWRDTKQWGWGWFGVIPHHLPSMSPIHGERGNILELGLREQGTLWAEIDLDGKKIVSAKLTIPVMQLETEEIEILAVCNLAKLLLPEKLHYVISFDPKTIQRGTLSDSERSFELYDNAGQIFLRLLHAQRKVPPPTLDFDSNSTWDLGANLVYLSFARLRDKQSGTTRLVLRSYKLHVEEKPNPP
jgi:hypothetical protein